MSSHFVYLRTASGRKVRRCPKRGEFYGNIVAPMLATKDFKMASYFILREVRFDKMGKKIV